MLKEILWPRLFRLADQVIALSPGSFDLRFSLGLPTESVTLTPYSVDNDGWVEQSSRVDRAATRTVWGASQSDPVILFSARVQPWKRAFRNGKLEALALLTGCRCVSLYHLCERSEVAQQKCFWRTINAEYILQVLKK